MESYGFMGGPVMALDVKGRLTVPAHFKEVLMAAEQGQMLVCKSPQRFLNLFPASLWPQVRQLLAQLPEDDATPVVRRMLLGSATPVTIDSGGRILIPAELREFAGLKKDVVFMGADNYFELWDSAALKEQEDDLYLRREIKGAYKALSFTALKVGG